MDEHARGGLDSFFDPAFVSGLDGTSDGELRSRLRESREEEEELSYVRRLLHGRLDILRAELEARRGGRGTAHAIDALQEALAVGSTSGHRGARVPVVARTAGQAGRRHAERIVSDDHLARLPDLESAEIESVIERASDEERRVSEVRRRLHAVIDALEAELASRYRAGLAPPV
jgi:hypothetical protein